VSLHYDQRLARYDIAGSRAHVRGLKRAGILSAEDTATVLAGLDRVEEELATGAFAFQPGDEDIHTAIERRLTEITGEAGARMHTGRSRNDQIATDLRLWCKNALVALGSAVCDLQVVLAERASEAGDASLPGSTHLQRAQPVLLAHHLLAHAWALSRDVDRLLTTRR